MRNKATSSPWARFRNLSLQKKKNAPRPFPPSPCSPCPGPAPPARHCRRTRSRAWGARGAGENLAVCSHPVYPSPNSPHSPYLLVLDSGDALFLLKKGKAHHPQNPAPKGPGKSCEGSLSGATLGTLRSLSFGAPKTSKPPNPHTTLSWKHPPTHKKKNEQAPQVTPRKKREKKRQPRPSPSTHTKQNAATAFRGR